MQPCCICIFRNQRNTRFVWLTIAFTGLWVVMELSTYYLSAGVNECRRVSWRSVYLIIPLCWPPTLPQSAHIIWLTAISCMTQWIPVSDLGFSMINPITHSKTIKKIFSALKTTTNTTIIIITMEWMCYIESFKGCEVIWWGGALVCTGNGTGHVVWQQEGRTCACTLLHTRGEAVCRCQSCPVLPETWESFSCKAGFMAELYHLFFHHMDSSNHQFDQRIKLGSSAFLFFDSLFSSTFDSLQQNLIFCDIVD